MSILSELFGGLFDSDNESAQNSSSCNTHPCSNCPSDCAIAGSACEVCAPYKKKLIDAVYYIDHLDEFRDQYEVTGLTGADSAVTCPHCGAQSRNHYVCEYCGSKLSEDSGKIKIASASDIPNPIMQAQDIIYERYEAVIKKYSSADRDDDKGLLSELISSITGDDDDSDANALGAKMSEAEIKEAASLYGVSVSDYLTGLDNGKYLTLAGRKAAASMGSGDSYTPSASGIAGLAGVGLFTNYLLHKRHSHYAPVHHYDHDPYRRPEPRDDHRRQDSFTHRPETPAQRPGTFRQRPAAPAQRPGTIQSRPGAAQQRPGTSQRQSSRHNTSGSNPHRSSHSDRSRRGPGGRH